MTDPFSCDPSNPSSCIDSDVMSYKCRVLNSFKLHWHKFKVQEISRTCTLSSHGFWCHFSESKTHRYRFSTRLGITNVSKITDGRRRKNEEMPRWYLQNIAKQLTIGRLKRQSEGKGNGKGFPWIHFTIAALTCLLTGYFTYCCMTSSICLLAWSFLPMLLYNHV